MSAYGAISRSSTLSAALPATFWNVRRAAGDSAQPYVTVHHLPNASAARSHPGLIDYLGAVMAKEIEDGMTYPQETMASDAFESYFFSGDVFLAISHSGPTSSPEGTKTALSIEQARQERTWEGSVAGYYYVKPNYPGRSSHICNGGFVVPPIQRAKGYGSALAKSYVYYAPQLGYRASVFNLVYINNSASVKLWEGLGFKRAGLIPKAGRLRRKDGNGEEYVDAWVFYKSFVEEDGAEPT
ncbi:Alternative cyclin Pcl12 [Mycena venus]|uniref:Alternative cyclin Pcl12 n=1 Tax=Mycena venus TaxID=2733690 RepID=A0A8H6YNG0_9AGAR|nr:Alternative cyclin Pcl12 [Mycena venus]